MRKACAWLLALALCGAGNATAALRLKLDAPELDPAQREASQQLLDEAADKLPPAFRERLTARSRSSGATTCPPTAWARPVARSASR